MWRRHKKFCLGWLKKFELAQNILGSVKGQGIRGQPFFGGLNYMGAADFLEPIFELDKFGELLQNPFLY